VTQRSQNSLAVAPQLVTGISTVSRAVARLRIDAELGEDSGT
jgi:hypothetical protein